MQIDIELSHCKFLVDEMYANQRKKLRKRYTRQFGVTGNVVCDCDDIIDNLISLEDNAIQTPEYGSN